MKRSPGKFELALIVQAVDDCTTVAAIFKLLEGFEGLLEREAIAKELERKYLELLSAFSIDLRQVRRQTPVTMRFGSTAKVLAKCKLKYYRISE